jgi:transposase-like protein
MDVLLGTAVTVRHNRLQCSAFAFKLSSRDLVEMMSERGIALAHTTILRWVQRYVPEFEKRWGQLAGHGAVTRPI